MAFMVLDGEVSTHPSVVPALGVGLLCNLMFLNSVSECTMLLTSTGVIPRWQDPEGSALWLRQIDDLNKNTAHLSAEAGKLIQESKRRSARVKCLETPRRRR